MAAVDKDGAEGSFSDFARFTVSRPQGGARGTGDPPPLVIESIEVRQNILQVRGRTEPGATLTVNGQRVDVASDGAFNEFIQLPAEKAGPAGRGLPRGGNQRRGGRDPAVGDGGRVT